MKTPIEKAAESIHNFIEDEVCSLQDLVSVDDIAAIIRRVLGEEVPEKMHNPTLLDNRAAQHDKELIAAYNQCRRDIGLEDL